MKPSSNWFGSFAGTKHRLNSLQLDRRNLKNNENIDSHPFVILALFYDRFFCCWSSFSKWFQIRISMDESVEVLRAIYCRPNELLVDEQAETITYNAFDDHQDSIGFSVIVFKNLSIIVDSQRLTNEQLKQLRAQASLTSTLYDLFVDLKSFYEELMKKRREETMEVEEDSSTILIKIDHMRSPTIYMKHLRQWTQECNITGRVLVIPREIFLLIEGTQENLKVDSIDRSILISLFVHFRNSSWHSKQKPWISIVEVDRAKNVYRLRLFNSVRIQLGSAMLADSIEHAADLDSTSSRKSISSIVRICLPISLNFITKTSWITSPTWSTRLNLITYFSDLEFPFLSDSNWSIYVRCPWIGRRRKAYWIKINILLSDWNKSDRVWLALFFPK